MKRTILAIAVFSLIAAPAHSDEVGKHELVLPGAPEAVFSAVRLSSWNGNFARVVRASDRASFDIRFRNGVPDYNAALKFANGSSLTYSILYDQSGNGHDLTQPTAANQPDFSVTSLLNGIMPIIVDGTFAATQKSLLIPRSLSLARDNFSYFTAMRPTASLTSQSFFEFTNEASVQMASVLDADADRNSGINIHDGSTVLQSRIRLRAQMTTLGYRSAQNAQLVTVNGQAASPLPAAGPATMNTGGTIGSSLNPSYPLRADIFAIVFYNSAVSDAVHDAVMATFDASFSIPQHFTTRLIYGGSSGIYGLGSTLNQNIVRKINMPSSVEIYNFGISGQGLASEYANAASVELAMYDARKASFIVVMDAPSNDIASARFQGAADATAQAKAFYRNVTLPFVAAIKSLSPNASAVVPTVIPRSGFDTTSNWWETARVVYNDLVVSGAAMNGYIASDRTGHVGFSEQDSWKNKNYYFDGIHPNDTGYSVLARIDGAAILSQVR
ncbi:SGNH/GDSL hydrolase family protein [Bradyrhizobium sp. RD5-C2]|uniref:arabinofuranosidase catalytic domain-containing protein n=1 Tax=Bradyrhizobium sp. RD5-C2 TaxID=244562 RepID=UPI001CC4F80A|nr:SGNH/GDSL hydrolase family protein [Bradyrhizobium sp. RD5-C2]GIQ77056.1 hypothetical protein BraRD5C2_55040 [Bradyrhizobium sp. RD5-C2]